MEFFEKKNGMKFLRRRLLHVPYQYKFWVEASGLGGGGFYCLLTQLRGGHKLAEPWKHCGMIEDIGRNTLQLEGVASWGCVPVKFTMCTTWGENHGSIVVKSSVILYLLLGHPKRLNVFSRGTFGAFKLCHSFWCLKSYVIHDFHVAHSTFNA